jgi:hypothetical protein
MLLQEGRYVPDTAVEYNPAIFRGIMLLNLERLKQGQGCFGS